MPFPAGGGTDLIARDVANKAAASGYTFIIDNKPGSGGNIGVDTAAKAAPDGYTLVMGQTSNTRDQPHAVREAAVRPAEGPTPTSLVASSPERSHQERARPHRPSGQLRRRHGKIPAAVMDAAPSLRVISKHGSGTDTVDKEAARARGIEVRAAEGSNAAAVAEQALALLLACAKSIRHDPRAGRARNGHSGILKLVLTPRRLKTIAAR